ncbi:MAG: ABC transporter C-terminal domain-containing protein, partial [Egibacteraceae bacterium]
RRAAPPRGPVSRTLSYRQRRELDQLGAALPQLEARRAELESALRGAAGDYESAQRLGAELAGLLVEIDHAETRWLELSEIDG